MKPFIFKIGGEAGYGIMSAGLTFAKVAVRSGYHVFSYTEYPSIIRGGHNIMQIALDHEALHAPYQHTNFLIALNQETIDQHAGELAPGSGLLYDRDGAYEFKAVRNGVHLFAIPLRRLAVEVGGSILMRNNVALGAAMAFLGAEVKIFQDLIAEEFKNKSPEITKRNQAAAAAGFDYVLENYPNNPQSILKKFKRGSRLLVMTGNEAVALGAIAAGMQFVSIYPMTPTSNILHVLAPLQEECGFIYKQPEDEIAAINMAIGASFAGARSMVATAGGGFSLMVEGYGLAGMTETPLVIIEGMRPGPATGLPTWTGQGDLRFLLHAHQDDFPRIVLAAGDVAEAFHLTMKAFNLADKYQTPVVVLVDKQLCESHESVEQFDYRPYRIERGKILNKKSVHYRRYAWSDDGVSLRAFPGQGVHFVANSDEHDENGYSSEAAAIRTRMMTKRMRKLETCAREDMADPTVFGPPNADTTIVSWGSTKGAILEALKSLPGVNYLHLTWINPFPSAAIKKVLGRAKRVINIEANYSAQMAGWIAEHTGIQIADNLLKYDGRPFYPEEIIDKFSTL